MRTIKALYSALALTIAATGAHALEPGDTLKFSKAQLSDANLVRSIEWSQDMNKRYKENYLQLTAVDGLYTVPVFVQLTHNKAKKPRVSEYLDQVSKNCDADGWCTLTVTKDYQYGAAKDTGEEFLVLHNKAFTPFTSRFMGDAFLDTLAAGAQSIATLAAGSATVATGGALGLAGGAAMQKGLDNVSWGIKASFGEYLSNF